MKRAAVASDADSSDDEVLMYSNKQKLTFSTNIGFDNLDSLSSSDSSSEEESDDDELEVLKDKTNTEDGSEAESESLKKRKVVPDVSLLSPSPPPPIAVISKAKKPTRKTRKIERDAQRLAVLKSQLNSLNNESIHNENDDELFLVEEFSRASTLKLKIRVHGVVEKYDVNKTDPLMNLITAIAKKENVDTGRVTLNWGNKSIDPDETAMKLGLTIADILECFIHDNIAEKENTISIKVQSAKKSEKYEVKMSEAVEEILKDFCQKNNGDFLKVRFSFDGERISDFKKTFSELDVIDGDVIDADLESS